MSAIGKDYKKGDPVRGAAILLLSFERLGKNPEGSKAIIEGTFKDLGVSEKQVRRYIAKHRDELEEALKNQGMI